MLNAKKCIEPIELKSKNGNNCYKGEKPKRPRKTVHKKRANKFRVEDNCIQNEND